VRLLRRRRQLILDAGPAVVLLVIVAIEMALSDEREPPDVLNALYVLAATVPLAWRRYAPVAVLAGLLAAAMLETAFVTPLADISTPFVAVLVAVYATGAHAPAREAIPGLLLGVAGIAVLAALFTAEYAGDFLFPILIVAGVWLAGRTVRNRALVSAELHEAAVRAEEAREAESEAAVRGERARIARELHDLIAHSVSTMIVQAGGARRILDADPARAVEAAERIERTGREALAEMRRLLGVMRPGEGDSEPARAPQPSLAGLAALVESVRASGQPVTLQVMGHPRPLPAGVELAAYRLVEDGLRLAVRHARGIRTEVRVTYEDAALEVAIADDGWATAARRNGQGRDGVNGVDDGHGLVGMRERTRLFGGELRAGRRPGGGFEIAARLPLGVREPA
jgi:signal transduction histidine kinase